MLLCATSCDFLIDSKEEAKAMFAVDASQASVRLNLMEINGQVYCIAKNLQEQHGNLWVIHKRPGETSYRQVLFVQWMKPNGYAFLSDGTYTSAIIFDYAETDTIIVVLRKWNSGLPEQIRQLLSNVGFDDWTDLTTDSSRYQIITERYVMSDCLKGAFRINPGSYAVAAYRGMVSRNGAMMFVNLSGEMIYDFEAYFESGSSLQEFFFSSEEVLIGHRIFDSRLWVNGKVLRGFGYDEFTDAYRLSGHADTTRRVTKFISFDEDQNFVARAIEKDPNFLKEWKQKNPSETYKMDKIVTNKKK